MDMVARLRRLPQPVADVAVTAIVAFPTAMDAWWNEPGSRQADAATYGLTTTAILALLFRRRWALPVTLVTAAALSGLYLLGHHGELLNLPVMVALYTLAVQTDRTTTVIAGVVGATWSGVLAYNSDDPIGARGGSPVLEMIWPLIPLAFGEAARSRRELIALAAAEREREAQQRVEVERAEMARDLHDVVAHTMVAVNVQMAAAVAAFESHPDQARAALLEARESSKAALRELRATVGLMRGGHGTEPVPQLDRLGELTDTVRAAGMTVNLSDDRHGARLPAAVELAAYRVIQEALTNVIRHSGASQVAVSLHVSDRCLTVDVVDDGTAVPGAPAAEPAAGSGFGLVGMAERVRALGGDIEHGRHVAGGYRVRATIPRGEER